MNKFDSLTPAELIAISSAIAVQLSIGKTKEELRVLSSMALSVASLLGISANQADNIDAIAQDFKE